MGIQQKQRQSTSVEIRPASDGRKGRRLACRLALIAGHHMARHAPPSRKLLAVVDVGRRGCGFAERKRGN
jgi:hypothetical protein